MAKRPHRYTEARRYLVGGSVGLLLIAWSALAMKDLAGSTATTGAQPLVALIPPTVAPVATPQPPLVPPAAPATTPQPAIDSSNSSSVASTADPQATAEPTATASPRPTQKPQTRSRGS